MLATWRRHWPEYVLDGVLLGLFMLSASAFGVLALRDDEVVSLNTGRRAVGNVAIIAAGTGLGEAMLAWDGRRYVPVPSEGGHADFAPRTDRADSRAARRQQKIDDGLPASRIMKRSTFSRSSAFSVPISSCRT